MGFFRCRAKKPVGATGAEPIPVAHRVAPIVLGPNNSRPGGVSPAEDRALAKALQRSIRDEKSRQVQEERDALHLAEQQAIWDSLKGDSPLVESSSSSSSPTDNTQRSGLVVIHNETEESRMLKITLDQERRKARDLEDRLKWVEEALKRKEVADEGRAKVCKEADTSECPVMLAH